MGMNFDENAVIMATGINHGEKIPFEVSIYVNGHKNEVRISLIELIKHYLGLFDDETSRCEQRILFKVIAKTEKEGSVKIMGLIKKIKEKKRESQIKRFYNYIDNAKYDLKRAINIEEAEFRYVKMLGALDLARGIDLIDTCKQFEIGNEIEDIMKRVRNIIRYEQSPVNNTEE